LTVAATSILTLFDYLGEKEISSIIVEKGTPGLSFGKLEEKVVLI
jgi:hypothetical protein